MGQAISGILQGAGSLVSAFKTSDAEWDYKKATEVAQIESGNLEKALKFLEGRDNKAMGLSMFQSACSTVQMGMVGSIGGSLLSPLSAIF